MPSLSACKLLSPPYLGELSWQPHPPLGSILLWQLSTDSSAFRTLLDVHASAPWCSLVIKLPDDKSVVDFDGLYDALSSLPSMPVFLKPGISPLSAIRNRRPPTAAEIVRYVECRPGHEQLAVQVRSLVVGGAAELSRRAIRHHFRQSNHFSPRHSAWMIQLAQVRTAAQESLEGLAGRYDMDVRTMWHRVHTCLEVPLEEFRRLIGWEWRVEAALRLDVSKGRIPGGGDAIT